MAGGSKVNFIKLLKDDMSENIWINADKIIAITPYGEGCSLVECGGDDYYYVKGESDEIIDRLCGDES